MKWLNEHKGFLLGIILFFALIIPGILMFVIDEFQRDVFMKQTSEVGELIKEEGGVTEKVAKIVNSMQSNGYVVDIRDSKGNKVNSAVAYGETLKAHFKYRYLNFFGSKELETVNTIPILRRDSKGSGPINDGGIIRTITLKSNEYEDDGVHLQTFTIPNLKEILDVSANTGSAEVVDVAGSSVVIRMSSGDPTRQEEIQDGRPEETKYIEDFDGPYYEDEEGFRGYLEKYLKEGEYIPGAVKWVSDWDTEEYEDEEGYTGTLQKYLAKDFYLQEDWKQVSKTVKVDEIGSGQMIKTGYATHDEPVWDKNNVVFEASVDYDDGTYKGTLYLKNIEWQRIPQSQEVIIDYTAYSTDKNAEELQSFNYDQILVKAKETLNIEDNNPTIASAEWNGNIEEGFFISDGSYYSYRRSATITLKLDGFIGTAYYEGFVRANHAIEPTIPSTYEYSEDFYYGILEKDGEPVKRLISGTPADTKIATAYATHDEPVWNKNDVVFDSSVPYSKDGYSGLLYLKNIEWTRVPQSNEITVEYTAYSTDKEADELHQFDFNYIANKIAQDLSLQDNHPTVKSAIWTGDIESGFFIVDGSYYSYKRTAFITLTVDGFIGKANYEGTVTKPDTRVWEVFQTYSGTVHRPEIDEREYKYQGIVVKPEVDTRVYKYRGYVTRPAIPNSGAMKNYYQYTLTVKYEAWE